MPWSRKRPDGYELKWLLSLATGSHRGVAPFLIEDVTPRTERIPQQFNHKNRVTGIDKITVAVGELAQIEKWYGPLLGAKGEPIAVDELGAEGFRFRAGPHVLEFFTPRSAASPLVDWLRIYGPSPYSAVLKDRGSAPLLLNTSLTHGANLLRRINCPSGFNYRISDFFAGSINFFNNPPADPSNQVKGG